MSPDVGINKVEAMRRNVVLPAPFRPRRATRSPRWMERDTPRSASTPGPIRPRYTFRTSVARRASWVTGRCKRKARIKLDSVCSGPRFLGARRRARAHHREGRPSLRLLLLLAHLDRRRDGPDVAERILKLAVSFSPELVLERQRRLRARVQGLVPKFVDVFRIDVQVHGRRPRVRRTLRIAAREFIGHHDDGIPDPDRRMHESAIGHRRPINLLRAERSLVELDRL